MAASDSDRDGYADFLCVDAYMESVVYARALATAFELGLIDYFVENPSTHFDDIQKRFKIDNQGLTFLIHLLAANRVIEKRNGEIRLSRQFSEALQYRDLMETKIKFANFVAADFTDLFTLSISRPDRFTRYSRMFDLFNYRRGLQRSAENVNRTKRWMQITTALTKYEAQVCMHHHDFSGYRQMLDIGGNSGEFALQICKKHPEISATVLDLPLVCDIGAEHIQNEPEADRIQFIKGDGLRDTLPANFDLITIKSMLHDWPEKEAKQIIANAGRSLQAGGTLLIFERGPLEDGNNLPYSMIPFLLFFRSFRTPSLYQEQLMKLGFRDVAVEKIYLETPFFMVTAKKRI